jgi:hypothetical protein
MICACAGGCYVPVDREPVDSTKFGVLAGSDMNVVAGDTVRFSGLAHHRKKELRLEWTQLSGPSVSIADSTLLWARFEAPSVSTTTSLKFRLQAKTGSGGKKSDTVNVVVEPTSATALCLQAPLNATSYVWTSGGCTTNSAEIAGDTRVATLYRQGEAEPNGSLQAANPMLFPAQISTERVAADIDGSIHSASGDSADYYVFTPPISGDYTIYLCNDPLACQRGTVTDEWTLVVYDQDFELVGVTCCLFMRQSMSRQLSAGLPYYVSVVSQKPNLKYWEYNLTIISD